MNTQEYIDLLRCPHCAAEGKGKLSAPNDKWLSCGDCGAQYPIVDEIPVMLPEEGEKWRGTPAAELPDISRPVHKITHRKKMLSQTTKNISTGRDNFFLKEESRGRQARERVKNST